MRNKDVYTVRTYYHTKISENYDETVLKRRINLLSAHAQKGACETGKSCKVICPDVLYASRSVPFT